MNQVASPLIIFQCVFAPKWNGYEMSIFNYILLTEIATTIKLDKVSFLCYPILLEATQSTANQMISSSKELTGVL